MKYAGFTLFFLLLLSSLGMSVVENVRTIYLTETIEVYSDNEALYTLPQTNPLPGYPINSKYGMRVHPISRQRKMHTGVDQACPIGTEIKAQGNGKVTRVQFRTKGYGNNIEVCHGLDEDGNLVSVRYAHLSKIKVKVGQFVKQGEVLAETGNSGTSTGPHLHYEYRLNSSPKNPSNYVDFKNKNVGLSADTIATVEMFEREYSELQELSRDDTIPSGTRMWVDNRK